MTPKKSIESLFAELGPRRSFGLTRECAIDATVNLIAPSRGRAGIWRAIECIVE